jgi:hypothetical protein
MGNEIIKVAINSIMLNHLEEIAKGTNVTVDDLILKSFAFMSALFHLPYDKRLEIASLLEKTDPFVNFITVPQYPAITSLAKHDGQSIEDEVIQAIELYIMMRSLNNTQWDTILNILETKK